MEQSSHRKRSTETNQTMQSSVIGAGRTHHLANRSISSPPLYSNANSEVCFPGHNLNNGFVQQQSRFDPVLAPPPGLPPLGNSNVGYYPPPPGVRGYYGQEMTPNPMLPPNYPNRTFQSHNNGFQYFGTPPSNQSFPGFDFHRFHPPGQVTLPPSNSKAGNPVVTSSTDVIQPIIKNIVGSMSMSNGTYTPFGPSSGLGEPTSTCVSDLMNSNFGGNNVMSKNETVMWNSNVESRTTDFKEQLDSVGTNPVGSATVLKTERKDSPVSLPSGNSPSPNLCNSELNRASTPKESLSRPQTPGVSDFQTVHPNQFRI